MKKFWKTMALALVGAFAIASCGDDVPAPSTPGGDNSGNDKDTTKVQAIEVSCAEAAKLCNALADGATSTELYAVTGYITDVYTTISKGQQSFWMDDTKNGGKVLQAYWANLPEGVSEFAKGAKVKITGNLLKYVNSNTGAVTPEIKNAKVEILEANDDVPTPSDTISTNCADAAAVCNALDNGATTNDVYKVTGYITEIVGNVSRDQQSFWMADTKDGGKVLQAYWANLPAGTAAFIKGSKVIITGKITKYLQGETVVPEIKNADVEILEVGEDTGDNGDSNKPLEGAKGTGTLNDPFNVAAAINKCLETGETATTDKYYVKGIVSRLDSKYANTFFISEDGANTNELEFYNGLGIDGATINQGDVAVGDEVVLLGQLQNYKSNTPELIKGCEIVSIKKGEGDKGENNDSTQTAAADVVIDLGAKGFTNAEAVTTVTEDIVSLTFGKGEGSNDPKYYDATKGVRMYAKNTLNIACRKQIAKVTIECDSYSGTDYVGNPDLTVNPGKKSVEGAVITIDGVNANETLVVNEHTSTSGGVQLRIKRVLIDLVK